MVAPNMELCYFGLIAFLVVGGHCRTLKHKRAGKHDVLDGERWLDDYLTMDEERMQADAPGEIGTKHRGLADSVSCPPVPSELPAQWCDMATCVSDKDCSTSTSDKCCFNGCVKTCVSGVLPPPVVDWIKEPKRKKSGRSWLVEPDSEEQTEYASVETCSTTKTKGGGDPLLCPHGLVCNITHPGDPDRGTPNWGTCVPETTQQEA